MISTEPISDRPVVRRWNFWFGCLCAAALAGLLAVPASGGDFNIWTPYADLDWTAYGQHKANLHTHTTESDGWWADPAEAIDAYREQGYDVLSLTDHNMVTWPWTDFGRDPDDLDMVAVEGNEPSSHHHIGSYFNDFSGSNRFHDSLRSIGDKDGLAVMFHPGRYNWTVGHYVDAYRRYDHLIGMEVYRQGDSHSGDRALWDEVLTQLGRERPVWGYSNDDTHRPGHAGRNHQTFILPELTEDAVRTAMEKGHFYFSYTPGQWDPAPVITSIDVDEQAATISISAEGYNEIRWVSQGNMLDVEGNTLDLNTADATGYVRAELQGPTGRTYTQPIYIDETPPAPAPEPVADDLTPTKINPVAQWEFADSKSATTIGENVTYASDATLTFDPNNFGISGMPGIDLEGTVYMPPAGPLQDFDDARDLDAPDGYLFARNWDEDDIETATKAIQFSITIEEGYILNLESVVADLGFRGAGSPEAVRVVYSEDDTFSNEVFIGGGEGFLEEGEDSVMGYAPDGSFGMLKADSGDGVSWNRLIHDDLEGDEGQGLAGDVYFRIYAAGGSDRNNLRSNLHVRNLTITGEVVPEPATLGLLGIGGLGVLLRPGRS